MEIENQFSVVALFSATRVSNDLRTLKLIWEFPGTSLKHVPSRRSPFRPPSFRNFPRGDSVPNIFLAVVSVMTAV